MISFKVIAGKNKKLFVQIENIKTKQDLDIHNAVKAILYRKEYKPFLQGFNKNVEASYLFYEVLFPIQFWDDVHDQLQKIYNIDFKLINFELSLNQNINEEIFQEFIDSLILPEKYDVSSEKYKYQRDCAYQALKNKIGRIEIATSGGKTFITYLYCKFALQYLRDNENQKILIIVPSKLLAQQLNEDFGEYASLEKNNPIKIQTMFSGAKKVQESNIVVGTYQSLSNQDKEYFDDFKFIICDELHRAKAYSIKKEIFDKITEADYFFGMTGTFPAYKTLDYLHIVSMFGGLMYQKQVKELISEGVSVPVLIRVLRLKYSKEDGANYSQELIDNGIVGTDKYHSEKAFFQQHKKRNELICKLLNKFPQNALLLVDTIDYCYQLKDMFIKYFEELNIKKQVEIINGSVKNRDDIVNDMKQAEQDFILIGTYGTMSTGTNIPNIAQIYFIDGGKSNIRIRQSLGRGIRLSPGKSNCILFDFYDDIQKSSFKKHAMERINIYKEQNLDYKIKEITL